MEFFTAQDAKWLLKLLATNLSYEKCVKNEWKITAENQSEREGGQLFTVQKDKISSGIICSQSTKYPQFG